VVDTGACTPFPGPAQPCNTPPTRAPQYNSSLRRRPPCRQLLTAKPVVYLVNMSIKDYMRKKNKHLPKIFEWVQVRPSYTQHASFWNLELDGAVGFSGITGREGASGDHPTIPSTPTPPHPSPPLPAPSHPFIGPRRRPHHPLQRRV
jgi:hypothetical protein